MLDQYFVIELYGPAPFRHELLKVLDILHGQVSPAISVEQVIEVFEIGLVVSHQQVSDPDIFVRAGDLQQMSGNQPLIDR
jgi:hypothetical protein